MAFHLDILAYSPKDNPVEPLNLPVCLRVECRRLECPNSQNIAHMLEELGDEICSDVQE